MSDDSSTDFTEVDNSKSTTIIRFPLDAATAAEVLRSLRPDTMLPPIDMVDEIHILVSEEAIKKGYGTIEMVKEMVPEAFAEKSA